MPDLSAVAKLDFTQPSFSRLAWVSEKARTTWRPTLDEIAQTIPVVFTSALRAGLYRCASIRVRTQDLVSIQQRIPGEFRLHVLGHDGSEHSQCIIGTSRDIDVYRSCLKDGHDEEMAEMLGTPTCCHRFQLEVQTEWGFTDPTLPRALNTSSATRLGSTIQIRQGETLNTLLSPLGIRMLSHEPCSMSCPESIRMAQAWFACAEANGLSYIVVAMKEMLSWPVEWSALHGIAEIKTPILKLTTNTDATGENHKIQFVSERSPAEAAVGLRFPYEPPRRSAHPSRLTVLSQQKVSAPATHSAPKSPVVTLRQKPRSAVLLDKTFQTVRQLRGTDLPRIRGIHLSNYFNVIQLEDMSTGAAMNYCRFKSEEAAQRTLLDLEKRLASDPLLLDYLFSSNEPDLLQLSLKTSLVSALSRQLLLTPSAFRMQPEFEPGFVPDAEAAVVIGFGGYLDHIIRRTATRKIHISDLDYRRRARRMDGALNHYRQKFPHKEISICEGSEVSRRLADADLVSITGSAFCSGTMDQLLDMSAKCKTVIVQGQSASVHPQVLFEHGVTLMSTTLKPDHLIDVGRSKPEEFRALLEGELRPVFYRPVIENSF